VWFSAKAKLIKFKITDYLQFVMWAPLTFFNYSKWSMRQFLWNIKNRKINVKHAVAPWNTLDEAPFLLTNLNQGCWLIRIENRQENYATYFDNEQIISRWLATKLVTTKTGPCNSNDAFGTGGLVKQFLLLNACSPIFVLLQQNISTSKRIQHHSSENTGSCLTRRCVSIESTKVCTNFM